MCDKGSKPHRANVSVATGVCMSGVVDSGADITIMGGEMFKHVTTVAKLKQIDPLTRLHATMTSNYSS